MNLRFQERALRQITKALDYVEARSPIRAAKIEARLTGLLTLLREQPYIGTLTSIAHVRRAYLTPYPYLIDYFVGQNEIIVLRFRHTARRPLF